MQVRRAPRALEQGEPTLNVGTTELNGRAPTLNVGTTEFEWQSANTGCWYDRIWNEKTTLSVGTT